MTEPTADEYEFLGDEAFAAGQLEQARDHYLDAQESRWQSLNLDDAALAAVDALLVAFNVAMDRLTSKISDVTEVLYPPQPPAALAADLRADIDHALSTGQIAHGSALSVRLGEVLEGLEDADGAESAYRRAVALARQVDADDPELMLYAFQSLIYFLPPSAESVALGQEMSQNLLEREEMYHPMRAAIAVFTWAVAELSFAAVMPDRVDHAIDGIARTAIEAQDDVCFHEGAQLLQRLVAEVLRAVGRENEAQEWQSAADQYEDWELFSDQQIPGHVHLWDIWGENEEWPHDRRKR